jgi:Domain of unknown function (DUF5600)
MKHGLHDADMPNIDKFRSKLTKVDFSAFPAVRSATLQQLDDIISADIPRVSATPCSSALSDVKCAFLPDGTAITAHNLVLRIVCARDVYIHQSLCNSDVLHLRCWTTSAVYASVSTASLVTACACTN